MLKETFLNKLKLRHPDNFTKYDYSLVPDEFKMINKIPIKCLSHGLFYQVSANHYFGKKCKRCKNDLQSIKNRSNTEEFIGKAKLTHGDKYNYDKVNYINAKYKLIIACKKHGDFLQGPSEHLQGQGCPKCGINKRTNLIKDSLESFIKKAIIKHNKKYNYNKVVYINNHNKVIITCHTHGDFLQIPADHLNGSGCPRCRESSGERYISQVLDKYNIQYLREYKLHGYKYRYDFYLPEYNIYIEYHGRQHYNGEDFFGGKKAFKYTKRNDKAKIELIKRSSGLLIVIKYTFNTLKKIEDELIRLFSYIHTEFLVNREKVKDSIMNSNIYLIDNKKCLVDLDNPDKRLLDKLNNTEFTLIEKLT